MSQSGNKAGGARETLVAGHNVWRRARATKLAFLIDAAAYFDAFARAATRAEHSITILGWDFDSRARLAPEPFLAGVAVPTRTALGAATGPRPSDFERPTAQSLACTPDGSGRGGAGGLAGNLAGELAGGLPGTPAPSPLQGAPLAGGMPSELGRFLAALLVARPELTVRILAWDFSLIYTFEREFLPTLNQNLRSLPNLVFRLDNKHPTGASHHQKVVVIDDQLAFVGGLDFSIRRWDTPLHLPGDPRRVSPKGEPYGPFHDLQVCVAGPVARALSELGRERWWLATGERLEPAADVGGERELWPEDLAPDALDLDVGIARTRPAFRRRPAVREIETLLLEGITTARRFIYVENQFLTSASVAAALAHSLRRRHGPEVVLVLPERACGWLEEVTMGALRAQVVRDLEEENRHGRLHLYYPAVGGSSGPAVNLHDKLFIADDELLQVGSANLSNRSLALDTECNLAIAAADAEPPQRERIQAVIRRLRQRLLAEHLGTTVAAVAATEAKAGSLARTIDVLGGGERGLRELATTTTRAGADLVPHPAIVDPDHPLEPGDVLERLLPAGFREQQRQPFLRAAVVLVALFALAATWHWTPLGEWIDAPALFARLAPLRASPLAPFAMAAAFVLGNIVLVPVALMVVQSGAIFGPLLGALYALGGALVSAAVAFWVGRLAGQEVVHRLLSRRARLVTLGVHRSGLFVIIILRLLPLAPFVLINLAAGASRIRFRHYMLGTLIGMGPGVVLLALFGAELGAAIVSPNPASYFVLAALVVVTILAGAWFRRRFLSGVRTASRAPGHRVITE